MQYYLIDVIQEGNKRIYPDVKHNLYDQIAVDFDGKSAVWKADDDVDIPIEHKNITIITEEKAFNLREEWNKDKKEKVDRACGNRGFCSALDELGEDHTTMSCEECGLCQ